MYGIIDYEWFIIKKIEKRGEYLKIVVVKLWREEKLKYWKEYIGIRIYEIIIIRGCFKWWIKL